MTFSPPARLASSVSFPGSFSSVATMHSPNPDRTVSATIPVMGPTSPLIPGAPAPSSATPTLPPMARFPTNTTIIDGESHFRADVTPRAHPAPFTPLDATYNAPVPSPPTAITVNFMPSYTINNPYVRPYIETLIYPIGSFGSYRGSVWRARSDPVSRAHWFHPDTYCSQAFGDETEEEQGSSAYSEAELYMSRLLSPTPQMYEDSGPLSTSQSR
ncbi:hypothetical protein BKA70DRAFT_341955 [Coprinopsis sp. MPI-PUGE-AT-0042]|nr:hypothetical protein BKA70DRAFT_341955 [Coprinopsis sp. MPI-PUGE-AT-0042]